ncbi:hypothetical protein J6590_052588 [Homalodisca vitripennis]|nr:hypothetical protein J6590_098635 [Homalodisca vitripennis]KAG8316377.1 hypothetical protein J6590_052588 [Homalodisca vitripennis]
MKDVRKILFSSVYNISRHRQSGLCKNKKTSGKRERKVTPQSRSGSGWIHNGPDTKQEPKRPAALGEWATTQWGVAASEYLQRGVLGLELAFQK